MTIDSVFELLGCGDTALVLFTRGQKLHLRPDGTGFTGNWRLDRTRKYQRVVIYNRGEDRDGGGDVILADHIRTDPTQEPGRYAVHFQNATRCGTTNLDWKEFANTGQNSVRYVSCPQ